MSAQLSAPISNAALSLPTAYWVGRDDEGHWVAVDSRGFGGGMFRSREAATDFAEFETDHRPGAVLIADQPLRLAL